jgi:type IV pilus assembly protein PilM
MMMGRFSANTPVIGLDIGTRSCKALQLGWAGQVRMAGSFPRTAPGEAVGEAEACQIAEVLDRMGFAGRDVVLAVPDDQLLSGILELPPRRSGAPVDQIARVELSNMHGCAPGSFEMCCWDLPAARGQKEASQVMAVACPHEVSEPLLDVFDHAGLTVQALDLRNAALVRACSAVGAGPQAVTAILDIGWQRAELILVYRDVILYERRIPEGGVKELSGRLVKALGLDDDAAETLATFDGSLARSTDDPDLLNDRRRIISDYATSLIEELEAPFAYASRQYDGARVQRTLLVGGGASVPGLVQRLAGGLEVDVDVACPAEIARCGEQLLDRCGPSMTVALGLAMSKERLA